MIQIFAPKSGSDAVKQEELPDFFTILFFVINFCFTNQVCFDLKIWTAWIRQRRKNLNQYNFGPVYISDFILRYDILILVKAYLFSIYITISNSTSVCTSGGGVAAASRPSAPPEGLASPRSGDPSYSLKEALVLITYALSSNQVLFSYFVLYFLISNSILVFYRDPM